MSTAVPASGIGAAGTASSPALPLGRPLAPVAGRSIREEVHDRLRDAILNVRLLPGTALSENEIVEMLQVSRTPIREALQRLSNEGLIQVIPQVGTFVARMDLARIREALFMREAIECAAMAKLPKRLADEHIDGLKRIVSEHGRAVKNGELEAILAADEAFHRRLLELAGVPGVWRYVLEARELHRRVRVLGHDEYSSAKRSVSQHAVVVSELAAGRPARASDAMCEHIRMNAAMAEDMASRHPAYFTAMEPFATSALVSRIRHKTELRS